MNIEKIQKQISSKKKEDADKIEETCSQIENLQSQLSTVIKQLDETFRTGDIVKGERLSGEKASLESRINYLETFVKRRKDLPLFTKDEAVQMKTDITDEVMKELMSDVKKFDTAFKDIVSIVEHGTALMDMARDCGNQINALQKTNGSFSLDTRINAFYVKLRVFVDSYKLNTGPVIEGFIKEYASKE